MPTILRGLPFYEAKSSLRIPDGPAIEIKDHQIVFWVSVTQVAQAVESGSCRRFPALLDLGFNGHFLMREDHVRDWAQLTLAEDCFPFVGTLRLRGDDVPRFDASVWIHANMPGFRDQFSDHAPFRLELDTGLAICPVSMTQFRLPLIGLAALRTNRLHLIVNGEKKYISLRAPSQR